MDRLKVARELLSAAESLMASPNDADAEAIRRMAPGARRRMERERRLHEEGLERAENRKRPQAEWERFEGLLVLRVPGSDYVAVPGGGRKSAQVFDGVDLRDRRDVVAQIGKREIYDWLRLKAED